MKAVIYTRFSPRKNADQCESIETQLEICRKLCDLEGYEIVGEYEDRALSGARSDTRPGFQAALDHACREQAVLVVYSLSRFARSTRDAIVAADRLQRAGANLVSKKEAIDTTTPTGRFVFTVFSALNELEREQIADRTRDAMIRHQANGRRMSKEPPYGWRVDPRDSRLLIEDEKEQAQIKEIISLYRDERLGLRAVAQRMQCRGRCRTRRWHTSLIRAILIRAGVYEGRERGRQRKGA